MLSRNLGPAMGTAIGLLFYLANTVATSMYLVGGVEILLMYMLPKQAAIGGPKALEEIGLDKGMANNIRVYATALLLLEFAIVAMGVKLVQCFAPISLVCVIISILSVYAGAIQKTLQTDLSPKVCLLNDRLLMRDFYQRDEFDLYSCKFCNSEHLCRRSVVNLSKCETFPFDFDSTTRQSSHDGSTARSLSSKINSGFHHSTVSILNNSRDEPATTIVQPTEDGREAFSVNSSTGATLQSFTQKELVPGNELLTAQRGPEKMDLTELKDCQQARDEYETCLNTSSVRCENGITGFAATTLEENTWNSYMAKGETRPDTKGETDRDVMQDIKTSFFVLMGIYFPSVTGIMTGSNMSGDLKNPQKSIPVGTIAAQVTTSLVYLSFVFVFGGTMRSYLLWDKYGASLGNHMVVSSLVWPHFWVLLVGSFTSTFGAALQCLCSKCISHFLFFRR